MKNPIQTKVLLAEELDALRCDYDDLIGDLVSSEYEAQEVEKWVMRFVYAGKLAEISLEFLKNQNLMEYSKTLANLNKTNS